MKSILIVLIPLLLPMLMMGQSLDRWVIGTNGTSGSAGAYELDYTVGEVATETVEQGSFILNQGFHQSNSESVGIQDLELFVNYRLYPNPASDMVYLEFESSEEVSLNLKVVDAIGQEAGLPDRSLQFSGKAQTSFEMTELASGYYFIVVSDVHSNEVQTFRVLKN